MTTNVTNSVPMSGGAAALAVADLFDFHARYHADRVALDDLRHSLTYAQLDERSNRLANALSGLGVGHGDRVAILAENRREYVELELAAAKSGTIVAALNWRLAPGELERCIQLVEPRVILASTRYLDLLETIAHGAARVVCIEQEYESLLAVASASRIRAQVDPEDGLMILYTSGTTGVPKGAVISHRAFIARAQVFALDQRFEPEDNFVAWAPLFHMASTDQTLARLMSGGKVTVVDGFKPEVMAELVGRETIGWLLLLPGTVDEFSSVLRRRGARVACVRVVGAMADLVPLHQIAEVTQLLRAPYLNTFGSTETGMPPASKGVIRPGELPRDLAKVQNSWCRIRLVDDSGNEVPDGEPGELTIRSATLFSGYWHDPSVNAVDFRGGWFHMGDVFTRGPDGRLSFVDRRKYLIKSGGENIYPAEIERLLLADARIDEAVVVRKRDAHWGEIPVAYVVRKDTRLTDADVLACCDGHIARYKWPKEVRFVEQSDLPRSATGKVERHKLEALLCPAER